MAWDKKAIVQIIATKHNLPLQKIEEAMDYASFKKMWGK